MGSSIGEEAASRGGSRPLPTIADAHVEGVSEDLLDAAELMLEAFVDGGLVALPTQPLTVTAGDHRLSPQVAFAPLRSKTNFNVVCCVAVFLTAVVLWQQGKGQVCNELAFLSMSDN